MVLILVVGRYNAVCFLRYLFIWLHQVLVAACGIFVASCGIFHCRQGLQLWHISSVAEASWFQQLWWVGLVALGHV